MAVVGDKRYYYVAALISTLILVALVYTYYTDRFTRIYAASKMIIGRRVTVSSAKPFSGVTSSFQRPDVVQPATFDFRNETFNCTQMHLVNMTFPLCHYTTKNDVWVTGRLLRGTYFEGNEVSRFLRLFRFDPQLQLVDIGANIGVYSLPAARVTKVLAVEPNWHSMARLAKAVNLGGVISNVTLVQNAISNVHATLNMGVHPTNQGNAFLINTIKCKATPVNLTCDTLAPTRTIHLNDLLPLMRSKSALMKVDVEGHEVNILSLIHI